MTGWYEGVRERQQELSGMIFRILCWSDMVDCIDGGVGFLRGKG